MKRFTATEKWAKEWYQSLSPTMKCLWQYICDNVDAAGVWETNFGLAGFLIGVKVKEADLQAFGDRIEKLASGKFWLPGFIPFQYGKLSTECRPHLKIFEALNKHGIEYHDGQVTVNRARKSHVSPAKTQRVIERDGGKCIYCDATDGLVADHVKPRKLGGGDEESNLAAACSKCNSSKNDKPISEFLEGHPNKERVLHYLYTLSTDSVYPTNGRVQDTDKEEEKEKEKETRARGSEVELSAYCISIGLPESDGHWLFDKWQGNGWKNGAASIKDWKSTVRSWKAAGYMASQKNGSNGKGGLDKSRTIQLTQEEMPEVWRP